MQKYINQLLEDIGNAMREEIPDEELSGIYSGTPEEHFEEIERWLEDEPVHTFGYFCGLKKEQFPPAEMLSDKQMRQLSIAIVRLLYSWNLGADFPPAIPLAKKYALLTGLLDEKTSIVKHGAMTFEFCTCDPLTCPFEEHCLCQDWETLISSGKKLDSPAAQ